MELYKIVKSCPEIRRVDSAATSGVLNSKAANLPIVQGFAVSAPCVKESQSLGTRVAEFPGELRLLDG
jgi:hypothetical protein